MHNDEKMYVLHGHIQLCPHKHLYAKWLITVDFEKIYADPTTATRYIVRVFVIRTGRACEESCFFIGIATAQKE